MAITGIGNSYNHTYDNTYGSQKNETAKKSGTQNQETKNAKAKNTETINTASAQPGNAQKSKTGNVSDYYSYLQKNYDCVKNGSVTISGVYLNECAKNPAKAKELEENLSYFKEGYENGLKSAQANARAIGAKLVNYSESWSIDSTGNITMMASTTVTSDTGAKGQKELTVERAEKLKEKKEQERIEERKTQQKELEAERLEKIRISAQPTSAVSDMYHKPIDIKA